MQDLLKTGQKWLSQQFRKHAAQSITYKRGSSAVRVPATIGRSTFEDAGGDQSLVRYESRDYLIDVQDLKLDGILTEPQAGDQIVEGVDASDGFTYEVMTVPGEGVWRYADQYRLAFRIHTKFVSGPDTTP